VLYDVTSTYFEGRSCLCDGFVDRFDLLLKCEIVTSARD
jgi:hypothetical protein